MEDICRGWYQQISQALDAQQKKTPQGSGPLAEIDYWRERNAAFSALFEQIKVVINPTFSVSLFSCGNNVYQIL